MNQFSYTCPKCKSHKYTSIQTKDLMTKCTVCGDITRYLFTISGPNMGIYPNGLSKDDYILICSCDSQQLITIGCDCGAFEQEKYYELEAIKSESSQ